MEKRLQLWRTKMSNPPHFLDSIYYITTSQSSCSQTWLTGMLLLVQLLVEMLGNGSGVWQNLGPDQVDSFSGTSVGKRAEREDVSLLRSVFSDMASVNKWKEIIGGSLPAGLSFTWKDYSRLHSRWDTEPRGQRWAELALEWGESRAAPSLVLSCDPL